MKIENLGEHLTPDLYTGKRKGGKSIGNHGL